jgi:hypothetical protein
VITEPRPAATQISQLSPRQSDLEIPEALSVRRVVSELQLLLAARRAARNTTAVRVEAPRRAA